MVVLPFGAERLAPALFLTLLIAAGNAGAQVHWSGHGGDPQHTAVSSVAGQSLNVIRWQTPVDRRPQYSGTHLYAHYGSPMITSANTVIVPVKVGKYGRFRIEARRGADGKRLWRRHTNYELPPHNWVPSFSPVLSPNGRIWYPARGGTVLTTTDVDLRRPPRARRIAFFGDTEYRLNRRAYGRSVFINTPITADAAGNVYFGYHVIGPTPLGLQSGLARISDAGVATYISAADAAGDGMINKVAHNSAPALSHDGTRLYVIVTEADGAGADIGYLLELDSTTLAMVRRVRLKDPVSGLDALVHEDGTSSPTVGPDGDVYAGVIESPFGSNHYRGWLLHFDSTLMPSGFPGAFGWDDTASIVPAAMVPSYLGASSYLVMTKYNHYAGLGDGVNRLAILDPNDSMLDPISGGTVMKEIMTVAGPTPDQDYIATYPNAVREWCINTAAVDPIGKAIMVNNEDGKMYRWDTTTGTLTQSIVLTSGIGEAYTPTVIGPDGTVYAINNAVLFAIGN